MNIRDQVKTKTETYTTSKLAGLYGVTVGSTSALVKKRSLKPVKTRQNSTKYYDVGILKRLQLHYAKSKPRRDKTNNTQDLRIQLAVAQSENQLFCDQLESAKSTIEISWNELGIKNSQVDKLQDLTS